VALTVHFRTIYHRRLQPFHRAARNLTQAGPQGTVTSTWEISGRRTRIAHPDGFYVDQEYLVTGENRVIRENGATSGAGVLATYAYDNLGRRASLTRGDGSVQSYSYDAVSRVTSLADVAFSVFGTYRIKSHVACSANSQAIVSDWARTRPEDLVA